MAEAGVDPSASGLEINHMAVSTASHGGRHFSSFLLVGTQETTFLKVLILSFEHHMKHSGLESAETEVAYTSCNIFSAT